MIDQELLIRSVTQATSEVFSMMLDLQVRFFGFANDRESSESGLISLLGITGDWGGSGVFCCSPAFATTICSRMLGIEADSCSPAIGEEVLDVVAEVTNMIVGNIKNDLEPITGPLAIGVPTVIHGRNFHFRNSCGLRGVALVFTAAEERFEVRISLAPNLGPGHARSRIPVLALAQV